MFSDKTRKYLVAESREEFLKKFGERNFHVEKFMFGEVIFVRDENDVYAFENKCPHQGAKLDGCWIEKNKVVCPLHQYGFNVENGRGNGMHLETYPIIENKEGIYLERTYFSWFGE